MTGGVTLAVRQISSYPLAGPSPGSLLLMQPGGLGNPYASITAQSLVSAALENGPALGVGVAPPGDASGAQVFVGSSCYPYPGLSVLYNLYVGTGGLTYLASGIGGAQSFQSGEFAWQVAGAGQAGAVVPTGALATTMLLSVAGALSLPYGTLTVARDPGSALEVATMGWVGRSTVTSFNGRQGAITLNGCDIYSALCLTDTIATETWVNTQIQSSITMLLANHPFVFGWNGRTGAVYLTLADISCVFFQPGQQPITQTPPLTSNDYSIPNTAWVVEYIANEFAGGGSTLATQAWVLANTVNSFNGRQGVVTLTSSDVFDVGAAPLNSPAFSGIPTAPTAAIGQATGQIATTAFVQQAITNNTAGVSTFNTRSGDVVLETADITGAGGLTNPSANLTGAPSCPTAAPGTSTPQIANTQFVMAAIAAGTVTSFNTRTGAVTLTLADVTGVGGAPLVSPAFSSVPTAPTAAPGTNTVQLATTAFVTAAVTAAGGVSSFNSRTGAVTLTANDLSAAGGLVNPSVGLTGSPTATTATAGDNSTRIATTAFVATALSSGAVSSFNTRTGAVTLQGADITAAGGALLASPAFTGAPTAPTAAPATNNTQIATTAYVTAAILADTTGVTSFNTRTGAISLLLADITGAGGAPLASPSFTGVPLGPTATAGTSTTQLATTAFVQAAIASSGVSSFNARTGAVTLIANDISAAGGALLAGPTFTGVPAAPTASPGTNTTQLATTAFVAAALSALGTGPFLPLAGGTLTGPLNGTTATFTGVVSSLAAGAGTLVVGGAYITGSASALTIAQGASLGTLTSIGLDATTVTIPGTGSMSVGGGISVSGTATLGNISAPQATIGGNTFPGSGVINTSNLVAGIGSIGGGVTFPGSGVLNGISNLTFSNGVATNTMFPNGNDAQSCGNTTGQAWFQCAAFNFPNPSDPRLKENIAAAPAGALGCVQNIPVHTFNYKSRAQQHHGFDASEVAVHHPNAIMPRADEAETLAINLPDMIALLWQAVQELSAEVASLKGTAA